MRIPRVHRLIVLVAATALVAVAQRGTGGGRRSGQPGVQRQSNLLRPSGPNIGGKPYPIRSDLPTPTGLIAPASAYTGISPGAYRTGGRSSRYPIVPIFAPPLYYPGSYNTPFSAGVAPYNDQSGDLAASSTMLANQDAMAEQIRQLGAELEHMRSNPQIPLPPDPAPTTSPAAASKPAPVTEQIPIQIVLRNGQQFAVRSYAVMNGVLWDFSSSRAKKIPVSSVDVAASSKATEAAGGEFPSLSN